MKRSLFLLVLLCSLFIKDQAIAKHKYQVAACLMFYNEAYYLQEWIEYHHLIGIEHFYLFNNGSTDNYLEILKPYIRKGLVELFDRPERGENQARHNQIQCSIYKEAVDMTRDRVRWLAIIDADEFIYPVKKKPLREILKHYENFGGVYLNYLFFGTSHVQKLPPGKLIIESLTHCAAQPMAFGKSIVKPNRVSNDIRDPHRFWYNPPFFHVNTSYESFDWAPGRVTDDTLLLFHYYTGDIDHAMNVTFPRRRRWIGIKAEDYLENLEWMNIRENLSMQYYIPELKRRISKATVRKNRKQERMANKFLSHGDDQRGD
jgi:glycosyltransferase involved in cell wall biosynthesis